MFHNFHLHSSMAMEKEQSKLRILMFPWLAHGHITPFLELSNRLLTSNYFTIYLCSTSVNLNSIKTTIKQGLSDDHNHDHGSVELVELQMPSSPQLPPQLHTTKNLPSHLLPILMKTFQESSYSFSDIMDSIKPHLLIYDYFQPWAPKIASSKGIPSVLFSTSSATALSFFHHVHTHKTGANFPFPAVNPPESEMARFINRVVPNVKDADDGGFAFGVVTRSTDILLLKTCRDVEEKYIDYFSVLCKKKIVCTGPLISGANENKHEDVDSSDIMKWLSGKSHGSTIYISFGSECFLSRDQIAEIARGLQLCDVNFLWVIRFPAAETAVKIEDELPEGFLETVKGRGLVVPRWAPQTKILGHSSIAGFVSHCGWSSVIESMYYGVPLITMPMKSEQPLNAQMVVEAGVGVEVERDGNGMYVGEKVAKAIDKVMVEKAFYEGLRKEARRLGETIREKEEQLVKEVAEELLRICMKNKKEV